ncbi:MAG: hypothetical protein M1546_21845 [Chloroflexi bacterium]|nr:hypothetical protein [Chloroflexota bacterium]
MSNYRPTGFFLGVVAFALSVVACKGPLATPQPARPSPIVPSATFTTQPTPTVISTEAPTMGASVTPQATLPPSTPADIPDIQTSNLPKDELGRIIGGPYAPVINYSPSMITGKPCPRVTKWTFKVIRPSGLQAYGVVDDPCVVQNAIDDYVRTRFALPAFNTPESMKEIAPLYDTDPALLNGLSDALGMRKGLIQAYRDGIAVYNVCDKPTYFLLNVDARAPLLAENDGKTVTGKAIQITLLRVAKDIEPFSCKLVSYKDGTVQSTYMLTEEDMKTQGGIASVNDLLWNVKTGHWELYRFESVPLKDYYTTAKALWDSSLFKPF